MNRAFLLDFVFTSRRVWGYRDSTYKANGVMRCAHVLAGFSFLLV